MFSMRVFLTVVLGCALGGGVAVCRISHWSDADATIVNGAWNANRHMEMGRDRLLTARIATAATFALDPSEAVYMVAEGDSERRGFDAAYDYIIEGNAAWLDARYWSITMYAPDYFLVPNDADRFSFNMMNTAIAEDGSFRIVISPEEREGDWLPSVQEGGFYLLLRLYHPEPAFFQHLDSVPLPVITRVERS
jgi:hypothetical protein